MSLPCVSQVCTLQSPFDLDVADFAAAACTHAEIWLGKLETYVDSHSLDDARRLLEEHQITAPVASFQGGLLTPESETRRIHWEHFNRRLDLCRKLSIGTLVVAADTAPISSSGDVDQILTLLAKAAVRAAGEGVRLALEFQASAPFANNLGTALALIRECDQANLGICLDLFHFHTGPSKTADLDQLAPENLFHVQLCDLLGVPRELATDADRVLPGDGDLDVAAMIERIHETGYDGLFSVELMNPQIWSIPPRQFSEVAVTALRKLLGQARMK